MAITRSAKKAIRVAARRRLVNLRRKDAMRDVAKTFTKAVAAKDKSAASLLPAAYAAIDKAAKQGVISSAAAARRKSRLAGLIKK